MKRIFLTPQIIEEIKADACKKIDEMLSDKRGSGSSAVNISYKPQEVELDDPIIVNFTGLAWAKQTELMRECSTEIAWHGLVRPSDDRKQFEIYDILVYPQTVTGVTVNTDEPKYEAWKTQLNNQQFNAMRFQAHSHVNMGITPSGTDRDLYSKFLSHLGNESYYIFMIMNKRNQYFFEIYDLKNNAIYDSSDIAVTIEGEDVEAWYAEVYDANIAKHTYTPPVTTLPTYGAGTYGTTRTTPAPVNPPVTTPATRAANTAQQDFYSYFEDNYDPHDDGKQGRRGGRGRGGKK